MIIKWSFWGIVYLYPCSVICITCASRSGHKWHHAGAYRRYFLKKSFYSLIIDFNKDSTGKEIKQCRQTYMYDDGKTGNEFETTIYDLSFSFNISIFRNCLAFLNIIVYNYSDRNDQTTQNIYWNEWNYPRRSSFDFEFFFRIKNAIA